jgi:hypothetical protein
MPQPVTKPITSSPNTPYQPYHSDMQPGASDTLPFKELQSGPLDIGTGRFDPAYHWSGIDGKPDDRPGLGAHQTSAAAGWKQT